MISDEAIQEYVNNAFIEQCIINAECALLSFLKLRQEKFPSDKNNEEWLNFSDWVVKRKKNETHKL